MHFSFTGLPELSHFLLTTLHHRLQHIFVRLYYLKLGAQMLGIAVLWALLLSTTVVYAGGGIRTAPDPIYDASQRALGTVPDQSGQALDLSPPSAQDLLNKNALPFRTVVEIGRQLFETPYTPADGYGEGQQGPRQRWLAIARGGKTPAVFFNFPTNSRFMRLNGLDSQSCFECHNTIGLTSLSDTRTNALARKVGVGGGSAGFASTALINPNLQCNPVVKNAYTCAGQMKDGLAGTRKKE